MIVINLLAKNFFSYATPHMVYYGYESKDGIHDVVHNVDTGKFFFHVKSEPSNRTVLHNAVISHFGLKVN